MLCPSGPALAGSPREPDALARAWNAPYAVCSFWRSQACNKRKRATYYTLYSRGSRMIVEICARRLATGAYHAHLCFFVFCRPLRGFLLLPALFIFCFSLCFLHSFISSSFCPHPRIGPPFTHIGAHRICSTVTPCPDKRWYSHRNTTSLFSGVP